MLLYGLLGGVLIAGLKLIEYRWLVVEYSPEIYGGLVAAVFAALGIWLGLLITAIASVCYVATWELISYRLAPDFADKYAAHTLEKAKRSGATDAQMAMQMEKMTKFKEMYRNPLVNIALTLLEPLPVGLLFTLVAAGVLSRKRRAATTGVA